MPAKKTKQEVIAEFVTIHGNVYDYSLVEYVNTMTPVRIICPIHGQFIQTPNNHRRGQRCGECKKESQRKRNISHRKDTKHFISLANSVHGATYDYSRVNYVNQQTKITIVCKKHGPFDQRPGNHTQGQGCPKCRQSKGESSVTSALTSLGVVYEEEKRFDDCRNVRPLPFDFFLPNNNVLIEFDGSQHFRQAPFQTNDAFDQLQQNDNIKTKYAKDHGFCLIRLNSNHIKNMKKILREKLHGRI